MISGSLWTISDVFERWTTRSLPSGSTILQVSGRSKGCGTSSAVTRKGPSGPVPSKFLPGGPLLTSVLEVSERDVVEDTVAGDMIEGALRGDVAARPSDHSGQLDLPIHLVADAGLGDSVPRTGQAGRAAQEHLRPG